MNLAKTRELMQCALDEIDAIPAASSREASTALRYLRDASERIYFLRGRAAFVLSVQTRPQHILEIFCDVAKEYAHALLGNNAQWVELIGLIMNLSSAGTASGWLPGLELQCTRLFSADSEKGHLDATLPEVPGAESGSPPVLLGERSLCEALVEMVRFAGHISSGAVGHGRNETLPWLDVVGNILRPLAGGRTDMTLAARDPALLELACDGRSALHDGESVETRHKVLAARRLAIRLDAEQLGKIFGRFEQYASVHGNGSVADAEYRAELEGILRKMFAERGSRNAEPGATLPALSEVNIDIFSTIKRLAPYIASPEQDAQDWHLGEANLKMRTGFPVYRVRPECREDWRSTVLICLLHHDVVDCEYTALTTVLNPHMAEYKLIMDSLPEEQHWLEIRTSIYEDVFVYRELNIKFNGGGAKSCSRSGYSSAPEHPVEAYVIEDAMQYLGSCRPLPEHVLRMRVPGVRLPGVEDEDVTVFRCLFGRDPDYERPEVADGDADVAISLLLSS